MRWLAILLPLLVSVAEESVGAARILKVLRHCLDTEGRHTLSPSLLDRDAYQAHLQRHPDRIGGMAFDVQWKRKEGIGDEAVLRLQVRHGSGTRVEEFSRDHPLLSEGRRRVRWQRLAVTGDEYREWGRIIAWQITLRNGDEVLSRQRSFLWEHPSRRPGDPH